MTNYDILYGLLSAERWSTTNLHNDRDAVERVGIEATNFYVAVFFMDRNYRIEVDSVTGLFTVRNDYQVAIPPMAVSWNFSEEIGQFIMGEGGLILLDKDHDLVEKLLLRWKMEDL